MTTEIRLKGIIEKQQWEPGVFCNRLRLGLVSYSDTEGDVFREFEDGDRIEVTIKKIGE